MERPGADPDGLPAVYGNSGVYLLWLLLGAFLAACSYYATYEYLHWCMHKPKRRVVERSGIFFLLNGHHLLHHRYIYKNFF